MSVLYDYFSADSDAEVAAMFGRLGGPDSPFDTVADSGVDPVVQMGTLEELLTGRPYDSVVEDPRSGHLVASSDSGEQLVLTVTDALASALASTSDDQLTEVATSWSQTDEFNDTANPDDLANLLTELAALARRARASSQRLYCWASV